MKAVEERARVEVYRLLELFAREVIQELADIARDDLGIESKVIT